MSANEASKKKSQDQAKRGEDRRTHSRVRAKTEQRRDLPSRGNQSSAVLPMEGKGKRSHGSGPQRDKTRPKIKDGQQRKRSLEGGSRAAAIDAMRSDYRTYLAEKKRGLDLQGPLTGRHLSRDLRQKLLAEIDLAREQGETLANICKVLEVNPRAVYRWRSALAGPAKPHGGAGGLNKVRPLEVKRMIAYAQKNPEQRCRKIAYSLEKKGTWIGKTKAAEILKEHGLNHAWEPKRSRPDIVPADYLSQEPRAKNLMWGLDWTWVRVGDKFMYLTVLLDWYSRKILSWALSHAVTSKEVVAVVTDAVAIEKIDQLPESSLKPLLVADHGSPNVSKWTKQNIEVQGLKLWLSGIGRPTGNARTERVIGTLKHEEIKLQDCYVDEGEAQKRIAGKIKEYNFERPNMGIGGFSPNSVHVSGRKFLMEHRKSGRKSTRNARKYYWKSQGAMV